MTTPLIKLVGFERIHGIDTDVIILVKMIIQPKQMTVNIIVHHTSRRAYAKFKIIVGADM